MATEEYDANKFPPPWSPEMLAGYDMLDTQELLCGNGQKTYSNICIGYAREPDKVIFSLFSDVLLKY